MSHLPANAAYRDLTQSRPAGCAQCGQPLAVRADVWSCTSCGMPQDGAKVAAPASPVPAPTQAAPEPSPRRLDMDEALKDEPRRSRKSAQPGATS